MIYDKEVICTLKKEVFASRISVITRCVRYFMVSLADVSEREETLNIQM